MAEKKLCCLVVFRPTPLKNDGVKVSKFYESQLGLFRVWGIRPAKVCEASKLQSLFGASRLKASKPQSSKASLAPHASKLQSLFGASRLKASKPERLDAVALWRFGAWRLLHALALLGAFPTPQSLKA